MSPATEDCGQVDGSLSPTPQLYWKPLTHVYCTPSTSCAAVDPWNIIQHASSAASAAKNASCQAPFSHDAAPTSVGASVEAQPIRRRWASIRLKASPILSRANFSQFSACFKAHASDSWRGHPAKARPATVRSSSGRFASRAPRPARAGLRRLSRFCSASPGARPMADRYSQRQV